MSYSIFILVFVCIPLAGMLYVMRRSIRRVHIAILIALAVIGVIYATPWGNYLVATGIWHYEPMLIFGFNFGYLPVESYLLFVLQIFLTGLFAFWLWQRFYNESFVKNASREE